MSPIASAPRAPYALEPTPFPCPALATLAGRAPLGGPRELALACFLVARLVVDAGGEDDLGAEQRQARAHGAKHWLGSAALPAAVRAALTRLVEATVTGNRDSIVAALETVTTVTANQLDPAARSELGRLAQTIGK